MSIEFISGCPVNGCSNNKSKLTWHHHNCGYTETIDSEGIVRCKNGHNLGEFFLLTYKCAYHSNYFSYISELNYTGFMSAISVIAEFNPDLSAKLAEKLLKRYKKIY